MAAEHHDQLRPREDDTDGSEMAVHLKLRAIVDKNHKNQCHQKELNPVFKTCEIAFGGYAQLETFTEEQEDEEADEDNFQDCTAKDDEGDHDADEDGLHPAGEDDVAQFDTGAFSVLIFFIGLFRLVALDISNPIFEYEEAHGNREEDEEEIPKAGL